MIDVNQALPVSQLPRSYADFFSLSDKRGEPIPLLKHGRLVGGVVSAKVLRELMKIKQTWEEIQALQAIKSAEKSYHLKETITKLPE